MIKMVTKQETANCVDRISNTVQTKLELFQNRLDIEMPNPEVLNDIS